MKKLNKKQQRQLMLDIADQTGWTMPKENLGLNLKRFAREAICVVLCFGHEYKKIGNQHTNYLKCIKCGKIR